MSAHRIEEEVTHQHLELLRRLALSDPCALALAARDPTLSIELLDDQTRALVRVGAVCALDAEGTSHHAVVDDARAAGVDDDTIQEVIRAVSSCVGRASFDHG